MAALPNEMKVVQLVEFNKSYQLNTILVPEVTDLNDMVVKVAAASY